MIKGSQFLIEDTHVDEYRFADLSEVTWQNVEVKITKGYFTLNIYNSDHIILILGSAPFENTCDVLLAYKDKVIDYKDLDRLDITKENNIIESLSYLTNQERQIVEIKTALNQEEIDEINDAEYNDFMYGEGFLGDSGDDIFEEMLAEFKNAPKREPISYSSENMSSSESSSDEEANVKISEQAFSLGGTGIQSVLSGSVINMVSKDSLTVPDADVLKEKFNVKRNRNLRYLYLKIPMRAKVKIKTDKNETPIKKLLDDIDELPSEIEAELAREYLRFLILRDSYFKHIISEYLRDRNSEETDEDLEDL
jgi:hypothetical protein